LQGQAGTRKILPHDIVLFGDDENDHLNWLFRYYYGKLFLLGRIGLSPASTKPRSTNRRSLISSFSSRTTVKV
jgi:hypothetical protein